MDRSILYVSRQSLSTVCPETAVRKIVATARLHNPAAGITGALACTESYFAQVLEGPVAELEDLMHRVENDHRHVELTILREEPIAQRRLPIWSMAYSGPSTYVARQIAPLIGEDLPSNSVRVERLLSLLVGLASPTTDAMDAAISTPILSHQSPNSSAAMSRSTPAVYSNLPT